MNKLFLFINLIIAAGLTATNAQGTWTQKADFGGTGRWGAAGFSIGNKGYIGTGYDDNYRKDFWEYDPVTDIWTQKADFGGAGREAAVAFCIGNKGYLGTGESYDEDEEEWFNYKDFWEYDPIANTWIQVADFGGTARSGAAAFSISNKGYVGTGWSTNDFWEYNPITNKWTQKADFGGTARWGAAGFSIGSKGYLGTGYYGGDKKDFWEYDPATNTWVQKADFAGTARSYAEGFSINNKGYLALGSSTIDFWEYDPVTNLWTQKADFGSTARSGAVGFSIDGKGYLGTGSYTTDVWEYTPECSGLTVYADADGDGFGNGADSYFSVDCFIPEGYVVDNTDCNDNPATGGTTIYPGACDGTNGIDDNCDGTVDNGFNTTTFYADADGDGYGDSTNRVNECSAPLGYVSDKTDCDDANALANAGASEVINGIDDNCDGIVDANFWTQKIDFGGGGRSSAVGFSIGNKGYIGTGYSGTYPNRIYYRDFWEYNPDLNTWMQKADVGGTSRTGAVGFSIGNKGYVGTGADSNYNDLKDFWEYDQASNTWKQKADFGGRERSAAVGFSIGNKGYIGTGYWSWLPVPDFWEYNPETDVWQEKAYVPEDAFGPSGAVGFSIGNKGYIGTGWCMDPIFSYSYYMYIFWEYDPATDVWTNNSHFAGSGRQYAAGFSIGNKGYIGTGGNDQDYSSPVLSRDFWEFDQASNTWTKRADFGGGERWGGVGFSIGYRGYIGTGIDGEGTITNDFWEYIPECSAGVVAYADVDGDNFGDASNSLFLADCNIPKGYVLDSNDCNDNNADVHHVITYYADMDGDSYGDSAVHLNSCDFPQDYVSNYNDCDDNNPAVNPGATEILNGIDDNCDGSIDEGLAADTWDQKADFGGKGREDAVAFSISGKGYMGTGYAYDINEGDVYYKDFWEYSPASDSWTQKADFQGTGRSEAVGFSIGNKGYLGTGRNDWEELNDFWEYDPTANTWAQKADFAGSSRSGAVGFSLSGKGYIGTGSNTKDFWEYNPAADAWSQKADFGGMGRYGAIGFSIGSKGYLGTGYASGIGYTSDFWEYDPVSDSWIQKEDFGGTERSYAVGITIGSKGYVGTGIATNAYYSKDFWEYDPVVNSWTQKSDFKGAPRNRAACFSIGNKAYPGTGYASGIGYASDFWEYTAEEVPSCAIPTGLTTLNITATSAKLDWDVIESVPGYMVRYKSKGSSGWTLKTATTSARRIEGLTPQTHYIWEVKTFCSVNPSGVSSDWSSKQFFTTGALKLANEQSTTLNIYPNPTSGQFNIAISFSDEVNDAAIVQVLNSLGQMVYNEKTSVANGILTKEIQLNDASAGMYLVKVIINDQVYSAPVHYQK